MHVLTNKRKKEKRYLALSFYALLFLVSGIFIFNSYRADGIYSKELNFIGVYPKNFSYYQNLYVCAHEIGHYIYFKKLDQKQRNEWKNIHNDSNMFVSQYARINPEENFAETFAYTIDISYDINNVPEIYRDFFRRNDFNIYWR